MSVRNAILLIIRQNPGIDYTSLLNKVAANYSSPNSARAALSRTLKDLSIYGLIVRKKNALYVTDKASVQLNREMKNKLILKLNQLLTARNPINEMDAIVEHLHTLIERGKSDARLIKVARGSSEFTVQRLGEIGKKLEQQIAHLTYLSRVFHEQIDALKELDFTDELFLPNDKEGQKTLQGILHTLDVPDLVVESPHPPLLEKLGMQLEAKPRDGKITLKSEKAAEAIALMVQHGQREELDATLYAATLKAHCTPLGFSIILPHSRVPQ